MVTHTARVCINRVRLPILFVVSYKQRKGIFPCPRSRLRIWSCETGSAVPSRVSLLISILRLNLIYNSSTPRQPTCCTVTLEYGYIELYGCLYLLYCSGTCCSCYWWLVRCLLHMLGYCLTHSTANYLSELCLCQLHHLGPLFCPWNFMPYLGVHLSLVTLKDIATTAAVYLHYQPLNKNFKLPPR